MIEDFNDLFDEYQRELEKREKHIRYITEFGVEDKLLDLMVDLKNKEIKLT